MSKQREFWIEYPATEPAIVHNKQPSIKPLTLSLIPVREVSPELDAAYAECEKALQTVLGQPFNGSWDAQAVFVMNVLAALKKARGE